MPKYSLASLLFILFLFSCKTKTVQSAETSHDIIVYKTGYTLRYDDQKWFVADLETNGIKTELILQNTASLKDKRFTTNINLIIQDLKDSGLTNLNEFTEYSINQIKIFVAGANPVSSRHGKGVQQYDMLTYKPKIAGKSICTYQRYWVYNGHAYILTYTSSEEDYKKFLPEAEKVMDSFKIKEK